MKEKAKIDIRERYSYDRMGKLVEHLLKEDYWLEGDDLLFIWNGMVKTTRNQTEALLGLREEEYGLSDRQLQMRSFKNWITGSKWAKDYERLGLSVIWLINHLDVEKRKELIAHLNRHFEYAPIYTDDSKRKEGANRFVYRCNSPLIAQYLNKLADKERLEFEENALIEEIVNGD